jgi:hypothetical protein
MKLIYCNFQYHLYKAEIELVEELTTPVGQHSEFS